MARRTIDVSVVGSSTIGFFVFVSHTQRAKRWVRENVQTGVSDDPERFPVDDTRYARSIAEGMRAAGLVVK